MNALGYLRVMFTVEDIDDTLARLGKRGATLVGEVVQYEDMYRLCYIRGPEGILIGLAQQLGQQISPAGAFVIVLQLSLACDSAKVYSNLAYARLDNILQRQRPTMAHRRR